ncbi:MAG TPA: HDIG domain-containing protein [Chloroflexota bacterium]|nr:HDIG domain-containing protein [Chloroflexota bacterium]
MRRLSGDWLLFAFGAALFVALLVTLTFQFLPGRYNLNEGDVSPYDIKSPAKVTYVSQLRTTQLRQQAMAAVPDVYQPIADAAAQAHARAASVLSQITQIRRGSAAVPDKNSQLVHLNGVNLSPDVAGHILNLDDVQWQDTVTQTLRVVDRVMGTRITPDQVSAVQSTLITQVDPGVDGDESSVVVALARSFVAPTQQVDKAATSQAREAAADAVQPVQITVEQGETILRNGDIVTSSDVEKLEAVGLRNPTVQWSWIIAMALLSLLMTLSLATYLRRMSPVTASSPRRLALIVVLVVLPILAAKLTLPGRDLFGYLFPVAAAPMLLTILLDAPLALLVTALQAVGIGLATNNDLELVAAVLIAGSLGVLTVHRMERAAVIYLAGLVIAVADFAVVVAFREISGDLQLDQMLIYASLALASGALSAALALGTASFLGQVFGIATTMSLLELAHPSQPLFRRLLNEAPGTYHHSVMVANLSERAAAAIGADTLLVRIGGYYHDIGKLVRPYAFVENQMDGENVHDQLDAYTSARLILAHVTDGLTLAQKHGIPSRVKDLIAQHHGTTLVQYFYRQACQGSEGPIDESLFRYLGPKPQTREAGIMMLADGVEAAVRASRDHSSDSVRRVVDSLIQDRITSGQLDECDLTLRDLRRIREAFIAVLQSIYHPRIEYPASPPRVAANSGDVVPVEPRVQERV